MGLTTWTAARFFLRTITRAGTLTLQVAHTQEAAEEIFRIVHRFYDQLPEELSNGPLAPSQMNARQIAFPEIDSAYRVVTAGDRNAGRGLTVQNLHCSELARWPGDPAETLAGLRAALAPDAEEHRLMSEESLTLGQIGFRRQIRANFQGLAKQEYAEDPESCFLASGESIFEMAALEQRLRELREPGECRRGGAMEIWFPAVKDGKYLVAVDPAGGGSEGDYTAIEVLDLVTGLQCAEFAGHVGGLELARVAAEIAREYNQAWLVVERNNHGSGVLRDGLICRSRS